MLDWTTAQNEIITGDEVVVISCYEILYDDTETPLYWTDHDVNVVYDGKTFTPVAIKHSDIIQATDGKTNDVSLTVGNADRIMQYYINEYELNGQPVTIHQLYKAPDGTTGVIMNTFMIASIIAKKDIAVVGLSVGMDVLQIRIGCSLSAKRCSWGFKDSDCKYAGSDTVCRRIWEDCKEKDNVINFGGFPAIINQRIYV